MAPVAPVHDCDYTTPHNHHHYPPQQKKTQTNQKTDKTMSRSAADATRFTATGPYAHARPHGPAYKLPSFMKNTSAQSPPGGAPGQETPKQKVERLRAQARAARVAQGSSRIDRVVDVGREVANRAHKVMVYSLIAASGISLRPLLLLLMPWPGEGTSKC